MAQLERLRVYPVNGLDGIGLDAAEIRPGGTLSYDREYALFDASGDVVNGKRTDRVHELRTDFEASSGELTVETSDGETRRFDFDDDADAAERWFGEFFEADLTLRRDDSLGFVDRREMGPSVVSTATLRTVASWFDGVTVESARRRLRANVEVAGVPPFWEDRFEGVTPCGRCVVPQRDPDTGEALPEFRETFVRKRRETFPEWADEGAFDHFYTLMLIADVPEADRERTLRVGDSVEVID